MLSATGAPHRIRADLARTARLYRLVDHRDPVAVRREATRRIQVARVAGLWTATDDRVEVRDTVVSGDTDQKVTVRIYKPTGATTPRPVILFMHGGAFISGDLDFEHPRCLEICRETGFLVVSVDYRLAPEFPYPAALDDCLLAFQWLCAEGPALGADPARVAVAGVSAGGTLAAAVCLVARDRGLPSPAFQMLLYPVLADRLETPSMRAFDDTPVWDSRNCVHMWHHYLGPADRRGAVSPYAAPARATDLSGLPTAYVMTAEYDPLRDEGAEYARRLMRAAVSTELHEFAGTFHGFDTLAATGISERARHEHYAVLRDALS